MILKYKNKNNNDKKYKTIRDVIKKEFKISARLLTKLKKENSILLNNEKTYLDKELKLNDVITIDISDNEYSKNIEKIDKPLEIIYEDESLLAVNKPYNMPVHPSILHFEDTLSNLVQNYFIKNNIKSKIHIVNRLDRDTSGIVIFAKNEYIHERLSAQIQNRTFTKTYIAILNGVLKEKSGLIDAKIARKENSIIERCIDNINGVTAKTEYTVLKESHHLSLVRFNLLTGRTHQIRVHSKYLGAPILGDTLYGTKSSFINRQALHEESISFMHPITNKKIVLSSPIPLDMKKILEEKF